MTVSPGIAKALFRVANSLVKIVTYRYFKKYYPFETIETNDLFVPFCKLS